MKRIAIAFLVAPLIPAALFGIAMAAWGMTASWGIDPPGVFVASAPIWSAYAVPFSYVATLLLGFPAFLLFRRMGWLSHRRLIAGAAMMGLALGILVAQFFGSITAVMAAVVVLTFTAFGAATGSAFWCLANQRGSNDA